MFWSLLKENKGWTLLTIGLSMLVSVLLVQMAILLSGLIDYAVTQNIDGLVRLGIFYLLSWLVVIGLNFCSDVVEAKTIKVLNESLRRRMCDKLLNFEYEEYKSVDSGTYLSWFSQDVNQIESNSFKNFFSIVVNITTAIASMVALCLTSLWISVSAIVFCVIMFFVPKYVGAMVQKRAQIFSMASEEFVSEVKTTLQGYEELYSCNLLQQLKSRIYTASTVVERKKYEFSVTKSWVSNVMLLIQIVSLFANIILIGILSILNVTTIGMILPVTELSGNVFRSVSSLMTTWTEFKSSKLLFEKYEYKSQRDNLEIIDGFNHTIEVKDLSYAYGDQEVLNGFSYCFEKGKKYALIGTSGSGKTTLIRLILGQLSSYDGEILFDGVELKTCCKESLRHHMAYISQNVYLFNGSVRDNILMSEEYSDLELLEAMNRSSLEGLSLDVMLGENGNSVSGGQRQRIALARALIRQKSIIILDEGTSALDKKTAFLIESSLLRDKDLTVIMVTHHLNPELVNLYDEIVEFG